ncbi:MAG: RNA 2'-phosphotransferase [Labilithrix sp.]|nr:RNA 2'-phosphotransferase [Labilithrix sp.]MCW5812076.1 RNA 2'-phosphotransferase [Labilithrix sp.]
MHISKLLALALRHEPAALGIVLDAHGWAPVDGVVAGLAARGYVLDADALEELVRASDKQRFALSPDGARIRANQGHSIAVDLDLPARAPPDVLFHGTVTRFLAAIRSEGLLRRARTHVHLSVDEATAETVARRRAGTIVLLRVHARAMHDAGHTFYLSENGVWLTEHVPPDFLAED